MNTYIGSKVPLSCSYKQTAKLELLHLCQGEKLLFSDLFTDRKASFKWLFVEEGKGALQIGETTIPAETGDLFLIAPEENYNFSELGQAKIWIVFYESEIDESVSYRQDSDIFILLPDEFLIRSFIKLKTIHSKHFAINGKDRSRWLTRLQQLEAELTNQSLGFVEMLNTLLLQLLMDTARLLLPSDRSNPVQSHPLLPQVFHCIEENYDRSQFSLSDVAKALDRSPAYLTDLVRRKTGRTIVSWIVEYRMRSARKLLETTTQSVSKIAEKIGYEDTGYFIRQFRQLHGITPKAWRDKNDSSLATGLFGEELHQYSVS
jgi:AraC-like DNA-binding protein